MSVYFEISQKTTPNNDQDKISDQISLDSSTSCWDAWQGRTRGAHVHMF